MRRALQTMLVLLAVPLFSGCFVLRWFGLPVGEDVPYNPKESTGDLAVRKDIQFSDIPVPIAFVLRRDQMFSFRGHTFRFGRFVYEGAWTMRKTIDFYKEQMPVSGWKHVETTSDGFYDQTQVYAKGRERCRLHIQSRTDGILVHVRVYNAKESGTLALGRD